MRSINQVTLPSIALLILANVATAQRQQRTKGYQDGDLGISLTLRGEWTRVPQSPHNPWVAARFISDAENGGGRSHAHLRIVVLSDNAETARKRLSPDVSDPYSIRPEGNGYANYAAFVKASSEYIHEVGQKFDVKDDGKGKGPLGAYTDFIVREGVDDWILRRARVFDLDSMQVAIEAWMPKERTVELDKLWKELVATIRPFPLATPAGVPPDPWLAPRLAAKDYAAWRALPEPKRRELRSRAEALWIDAVKKNTGPSWRYTQSKRFFCVSPGDTRPDAFVAKLEVWAGFLDEQLGPLSDDRVRRWVLRMCTDSDHRTVFDVHGSPDNGFTEVAMTVFEGSADQLSYGSAHQAMFWTYLHDKNAIVGPALPSWFRDGMFRALHYGSIVRSASATFDGDDWGHTFVKDLEQKRALLPLRTIVSSNSTSYGNLYRQEDGKGNRLDVQCSAVVRFLMTPSPRVPQLKGFLTRFLREIGEECAGIEPAPEQLSAFDAAHAKVYSRVFGDEDETWRRIEAAYVAFVRN